MHTELMVPFVFLCSKVLSFCFYHQQVDLRILVFIFAAWLLSCYEKAYIVVLRKN